MVIRYLSWHYGSGFKSFIAAERNFIDFGWYLFSITELSRSLFAPWHQILEKKSGNVFTGDFWYALWGNVISRFMGGLVRIITIAMGLVFETIIVICTAILTVLWLLAPVLIMFFYVYGFFALIM